MKEKTVRLTETIETRIRAHRASVGSTRRFLLVPAEVVLDLSSEVGPPTTRRDASAAPDEPSARFLRAWVRRFE